MNFPLSDRGQGPIFLAGIDRSGIGLLGELLEAHPRIAVSRRVNFFSFYFHRYGDLGRERNLDRCLDDMLGDRRIRDLQVDADLLRQRFAEGEPTYGRLYALIQEQHARRMGKSRWADKSLGNEQHADRILGTYRDARIVHVVRDPRDRYASQSLHRGTSRGGVGAGTALWKWSIRQGERNRRRYPERYRIVPYEGMVRDPEGVLRDVCRFLGEDYTPRMLEHLASEESADRPRLRTGSIGRFQHDLSPKEIRFIQRWARRQMALYECLPVPVSLGRRKRFGYAAKDVTRNLISIALWRVNAALRESRGRRRVLRRRGGRSTS